MIYVLDSGAMIAYLRNESGGPVVDRILTDTAHLCYAHAVNLCEVYYDFLRSSNESDARGAMSDLFAAGVLPREDMDAALWQTAGHLKVDPGKISLADCFCLALAQRLGGIVLSTDHHEFDPLVPLGICTIQFIR